MSYTLTIEAPEQAARFEQLRRKFSQAQLGSLFLTFLMQQSAEISEPVTVRPVSPRVHALRGIIKLPEDFDEREFKSQRLANRLKA